MSLEIPSRANVATRLRRPYSHAAGAVACLMAVGVLIPATAKAKSSATSTSATASTVATSQNLLLGTEATFDGTDGGWTASNSSLSWAQSPSTLATGSLEMTADATAWVSTWSAAGAVPAAAGAKFTADASVDVSGSPGSIADAICFYNASGTLVTAVWGQSITPTSPTWTELPEVDSIAPPGTASVGVGVIAWTATVGQDVYVESPVLNTLNAAAAPAVVGPLLTSGNQIVQADGQPVTLRGVVLDGLENNPTLGTSGVSQQAIKEAKTWGANFVRVPLGEQFWLPSNCDYLSSYKSTVDQVVKWITSLGMVALLDLHYNTVSGCEPGGAHNMADEAHSPTFWRDVASRYGNPSSPEYSALVAFDLYNEPHNVSNAVWLNGGKTIDVYAPYQTYKAAGMQQLYKVVRTAGSQNLIFISGTNWANDPPSKLVNGENIVYAAHYYTCPSAAPPACTNPEPYDPSQDLDQWVPFSEKEPVIVTEFGWPSDSDATYLANVIALAADHGWGWSAFAWQQENWGGWDIANWLSSGTAEPNPSGVPVLLALSQDP